MQSGYRRWAYCVRREIVYGDQLVGLIDFCSHTAHKRHTHTHTYNMAICHLRCRMLGCASGAAMIIHLGKRYGNTVDTSIASHDVGRTASDQFNLLHKHKSTLSRPHCHTQNTRTRLGKPHKPRSIQFYHISVSVCVCSNIICAGQTLFNDDVVKICWTHLRASLRTSVWHWSCQCQQDKRQMNFAFCWCCR